MFVNPQPGPAAVPGNNRSYGAENCVSMLEAEIGRHIQAGRRVAEVGAARLSAASVGGAEIGAAMLDVTPDSAAEVRAPTPSAAPDSATAFVSLSDFAPEHENAFDVCVLNNLLDYSPDPVQTLLSARKLLKTGGSLLFYLPVSDSPDARKHKHRWHGFRSDGLQFFNRATIENALCKSGYEHITITSAGGDGVIVNCHAGELRPGELLDGELHTGEHRSDELRSGELLDGELLDGELLDGELLDGELHTGKQQNEKVLSIIVPVYNEEKTIGKVLDGILAVPLEGLSKEVIIVESNSADSTRRIVEKYARENTGIKLILEDAPKGKGHAVRAGFAQAAGDFIAIQDGDLEYDVNDYAQLVAPLVSYRKAFVLGSRHTESWKIRSFGANRRLTALYMNFGHVLFTRLINMGCGTRLKDPFTMYKLFRRECLYGLEFDGNRFEIDWEIIIKLTRKGYIPEEIPVNYNSRGYKEGKKVSLFLDPLIWIKSFIKYRFF